MGITEQYAFGGQPVQMRSFGIGVAIHATKPVVKVIDGNEQYIGVN
jgi:hypothetical protein